MVFWRQTNWQNRRRIFCFNLSNVCGWTTFEINEVRKISFHYVFRTLLICTLNLWICVHRVYEKIKISRLCPKLRLYVEPIALFLSYKHFQVKEVLDFWPNGVWLIKLCRNYSGLRYRQILSKTQTKSV